jgi:hypothetical protein
MKLKSFGVLKPKKEDYFFAYLLCIVAALSLWIGCGIAIQKSHYLAKEALQAAVDALKFNFAQGTTVVLASFIFYISIALAIYVLVMAILKNDKKKYLSFVGTLFTAVAAGLGCVFFGTYIMSHILYGIVILLFLFGLLVFNCYIYCDAMFSLFGASENKEEKEVKEYEEVEETEEGEEVEKVAKPRTRKATTARTGARKTTTSKGKKSKKQTYVKKLFQKKFKDLTKEEQNEYYKLAKRRKKAERLAKEKKENKAK